MIRDKSYVVHDETQVKGFTGEYSFLSNMKLGDVLFEGVIYPASENAYQAAKCAVLNDRIQFLTYTPYKSKQVAKTVLKIPIWDNIKYDVMSAVVFDKFYRNIELRELLISTKQKHLEETNNWGDVYWGVCNGKGENKLGKILMGVRAIWNNK